MITNVGCWLIWGMAWSVAIMDRRVLIATRQRQLAGGWSNGNVKLRHVLSNTTKHMADLSERVQADVMRMKIPAYQLQDDKQCSIIQELKYMSASISQPWLFLYPAAMDSKKLMDALIDCNKDSSQIKSLYNSIVELVSSVRTLKTSTDIKQVHTPTQELIRSLDPT